MSELKQANDIIFHEQRIFNLIFFVVFSEIGLLN